ncbi:hypothetical protein B0H14DRAFT_3170427 [Mycena olivaceomarginata]|nr:hypothetical protein B0H14DRAFT_3170427 [Mycena olivaceomarginata]
MGKDCGGAYRGCGACYAWSLKRRECSQHGRCTERGAGDGEGLSHVVRMLLVMRIGSVVRDKRKRGAPESEYHEDRGSMRLGVGWRRRRRSERGGNEWHAREKERPWQALGTPVVVYTWLGMHGGAGAERRCARRGCAAPARGAAREEQASGEEDSGAVQEMVVAGGWRGKQRMRWMQRAPRSGVVSHVQLQSAENFR